MKRNWLLLLILSLAPLLAQSSSIPHSVSEARNLLGGRLIRREPPQPNRSPGQFPKYFHEPPRGDRVRHYDHRYEHGVLNDDDRRDTQLYMLRAYIAFFHRHNLETWLAHGTLLGWWWNAKILPWDADIDTQVSGPTLLNLAQNHNGTMFYYNSDEYNYIDEKSNDQSPVLRQYLLDVNPALVNRSLADVDNIIDARWIDIRNGLFIDITGLFETEPEEKPGWWSCKNNHRYRTKDLYPMRSTVFEGMKVKVPYAYDNILTEEYQEKALVLTDYEGHRWHAERKEWVKKTPAEMKAERLALQAARQEARRKKQQEKAQKKKEKEDKLKADAGDKTVTDEKSDQGLKDPEKEPARVQRRQAGVNADADADADIDIEGSVNARPVPLAERKAFGSKDLKRRRSWLKVMTSHDED